MGQPDVSRNVAALEQHLRTRLLHRSTRKLTITPEGERDYAEARHVLDAVAAGESNARGEDQPSGLLRIICPTSLGRTQLLPWTVEFLEQYPAVEVDVQISDRFIDMVEEGVDLAIRIGTLKDSSLRPADRRVRAGVWRQHRLPKAASRPLGAGRPGAPQLH